MKYRYLGETGLLVSRLCLGTMTFGMPGCTRTVAQLEAALEGGDWDLPDDSRARLASVVPFQHGYPRDRIEATWPQIAGRGEFSPWSTARPHPLP